jgi:Glycosyltransferase family 87
MNRVDTRGPVARSLPTVGRDSPLLRTLQPFLRLRYFILTAWSALCCYRVYTPGTDWRLFTVGGDLLFGIHQRVQVSPSFYALGTLPGGLHVYANYRLMQTGPLTLLAAGALRHVGPNRGAPVVVALTSVLAVGLVCLLERTARRRWTPVDCRTGDLVRITVLFGGLVLMPVWAELAARYGHSDDALALFGAVVALWCIEARRPVLCGVVLGLAVAAKPWAIAFVPLVLAFGGRDRLRAAGTMLGVVLTASLPFVLADRATLQAAKFSYYVTADSPLALFGHRAGTFSPGWVRPAEIGLGLILTLAAVARGRWYAVLFVGVAARIALDPETFTYYTAGVLVGAMAIDLLGSRRPLPLASLCSFLLLVTGLTVETTRQQAISRLLVGVAAVAVVAWPRANRTPRPFPPAPAVDEPRPEPAKVYL